METAESYLMHEVERFYRGQDRLFDSKLPALAGDFQELKESVYVGWVDKASDTNHPRENMNSPSAVSVVIQCFF